MSLFKKSDKLADVCYDIRGPIMQEARQLEEDGYHLIKLNIGNPALFGFNALMKLFNDSNLKSQGYLIHKVYFSARGDYQYCQQRKFMVLN